MKVKTTDDILLDNNFDGEKEWVAVDELKEKILHIANDKLGGEIQEIEPLRLLWEFLSTEKE